MSRITKPIKDMTPRPVFKKAANKVMGGVKATGRAIKRAAGKVF